jgi:hypothetical protein
MSRKPSLQWGAWSGVLDWSGHFCQRGRMSQLLVGYAPVSTEHQELTAQRNSLAALGVGDDRIYVDHGLTGTNRDRPGLGWAWPPTTPGTRWW